VLQSEEGSKALAYAREADGEKFIIALNASKRKATIAIPVEKDTDYPVVLGDGEATVKGRKLKVTLPPVSYIILKAGN
jgi:hypothetical protein